MELVVNVGYYVTDAVVIFPCISIILYSPKNDLFIFHWLLISLSVFIMVAADLGYTFNASIKDQLLTNIEWLWSYFSLGYILLSVSILWFSKIKQILEYKKFSESLKDEHDHGRDHSNSADEFVEKYENLDQILRTMRNILEKAEEQIDVLFTQHVIQKNELIKFINILVELTRKNRSLNVRILLPSPKSSEEDIILSKFHSNISVKYFDRSLSSNEIASIVDREHLYILGVESENTDDQNRYFLQHVNSESKMQVYSVLFERMWLLEKSIDFEQISNRMF